MIDCDGSTVLNSVALALGSGSLGYVIANIQHYLRRIMNDLDAAREVTERGKGGRRRTQAGV